MQLANQLFYGILYKTLYQALSNISLKHYESLFLLKIYTKG